MTYKQWVCIVTLIFVCYIVRRVLLYLGYAVAQLAGALCYKPEGHGFYSRWVIYFSFRPHHGPGVDSVCYRNEYQEYFLGGAGGGGASDVDFRG